MVDNRVFVVDGALATSAGITAGIDVALHLVGEECGEALAASVAEDMVVYLRRSPRDTELSPFHMHRRHLHPTVHRVQDAIVSEPQRDWDMAALAEAGRVTERHLLQQFRIRGRRQNLLALEWVRWQRDASGDRVLVPRLPVQIQARLVRRSRHLGQRSGGMLSRLDPDHDEQGGGRVAGGAGG